MEVAKIKVEVAESDTAEPSHNLRSRKRNKIGKHVQRILGIYGYVLKTNMLRDLFQIVLRGVCILKLVGGQYSAFLCH